LLYAATEKQIFVSFDDGDHWQSLRLNMPSSSVRDITVKDDDLVAATHGRGFWILDDLEPLRQIDGSSAAVEARLFKPEPAYRVRWNTNTDTPLPPDEPLGLNPPEGAIIDYYLKSAATQPVVLEVFGADKRLVRRYSSADPPQALPDPATSSLPLYWYRPMQPLSAAAGMHRFTWDVHYQPLAGGGGGGRGGLPIAAVPYNTVAAPTTPWVNPGTYTVKLTVNGQSYTQPMIVKQDPRVKTPAVVMQQVYSLTKSAYDGAGDALAAAQEVQRVRDQIGRLKGDAKGPLAVSLAALDQKIVTSLPAPAAPAAGAAGGRGGAPAGGRGGRGGGPAGPAVPANALSAVATSLTGVMSSLTGADVKPTALQLAAITNALTNARTATAKWKAIKSVDVPAINIKLKAAGMPAIGLQ